MQAKRKWRPVQPLAEVRSDLACGFVAAPMACQRGGNLSCHSLASEETLRMVPLLYELFCGLARKQRG